MDYKVLGPATVRAATGATRGELRQWEAKGIITPVLERHYSRTYRVYDEAQVERIRQVKYLKAKGLTIMGITMALPELEAWEKRTGKRMQMNPNGAAAGNAVPATSDSPLGDADAAAVTSSHRTEGEK